MGKIFFICGKSSTGKDTIYNRVLDEVGKESNNGLKTITMYTTRPMRDGEQNGKEYFFVSVLESDKHISEGSVVEMRTYNTVHGPWRYYTRNDGQINLKSEDRYLAIGTLEAYNQYCSYYGNDNVFPIYIEVDSGIRLERALARERAQAKPQYTEMCRRFIADENDFSEEKIAESNIKRRFINDDLHRVVEEIKTYIISN